MLLLDANPLLYALREDAPEHAAWSRWLEALINGDDAFSVCSATLSAVVRIATSQRVFKVATPLNDVLLFIDGVRDAPAFVLTEPGPQHWALVDRLCRAARAKGNVVSDAYLAALAIETDAELISADHDFARFPRLRFRHPLARR
jgi:toxin-antitoxin system PIN domain toxin